MAIDPPTLSVTRALYAAAGLLQATLASAPSDQKGEPDYATVRENDLQTALAGSLQAQVGARVRREATVTKLTVAPPLASGRYGPVDVVILGPEGNRVVYLECKWCIEDKLIETLWDGIKLVQLAALPYVEACFMVCGAPTAGWTSHPGRPVELFTDTEHDIEALITQYRKGWTYLLAHSSARPAALPARFTTQDALEVPIQLSDGPPWLLRAVRIAVEPGGEMLSMSADGYPTPPGIA